MKEQRSLSVGSLPGNLKSHILKTIQFDHLQKGERGAQPMDVSSDSLNKIRELPEEDENLPRQNKALTQQDKNEQEDDKSIPMEVSMEDSPQHSKETDNRLDDDELGAAGVPPAADNHKKASWFEIV